MATPGPFAGISWSTANHITLGVIAAAVVFPALSAVVRLVSSPLALLLLSPVFVLFVIIAFVAANITLGYALDLFNARHDVRVPQARLRSAAKPLAFATPAAWQAVLIRSQWSATTSPLDVPLLPGLPVLSVGLNQLITLIVRDFVLVWYKELSSSPTFPGVVSKTIYASLENLFSRVDKLDLPALVVKRVLPKITMHIDQFRRSEIAVRGAGLERHLTQSDELDMLLASRYAAQEPLLKLHPAVANLSSMHTMQTEEAHLRVLVDAILPYILPEKETRSRAVHVAVREIVACAVIYPVMEMLSDPDFWNRIVDQTAGAAIRQQKLISKVRSILDTSSQSVPPAHSSDHPRMVDITSRTGVHQFEAWLRSISRIDSLLDARRLKNDIANEIRKKRILLANHDKEDWIAGDKTEDLVAYLQRLYIAKNRVEERIAVLSGGGADAVVGVVGATPSLIMEHASDTNPSRHTLRDILSDPNSLSYFMEFMDRRNRSQRVQFWLHVESFKNPLESVESGEESDDEEVLRGTALAPNTGLSATIKEDMRGIYDMYFSDPKSSLLKTINARHVRAIQEFAQGDDSEAANASVNGMMKERRVRRSALLAQRQVEKGMEEDFQEFERSDLWFHAVGDLAPKKNIPLSCSPPISPLVNRATSPPFVAPPGVLSFTTPPGIPHTEAQGKKVARPHFLTPAPVPTATPPRLDTSPEVTSSGSADSNTQLLPTKTNSTPSNLDLLFGSAEAEGGQDARAPLFADLRSTEEEEQSQRIEAIQAALTDIIADENRYSSEAVKVERRVSAAESADGFMTRGSTSDSGRLENLLLSPSISDERAQRRRKTWMFDDAEEYSYEEETDQAEAETAAGGGHLRMGSTTSTTMAFEPALPGDLQLSYDIAKLTEKITKLQSQGVILDALMRKAELTGDAQELRILTKSKSAMARELRELTFQRAQYEQQEAENRLVPDRTKVAIVSSTSMTEEDGKQVVRYLIEVQQLATDGSFASGWIVARRYNDFFAMHQRLKEKYVAVRGLDFPGKRLVTSLSSSFVDTRRVALERYLQNLIAIRLVCESEELRAFLSRKSPMVPAEPELTTKYPISAFPGQGIVRTMYKSVTESIDDMFFGPSMLDVMIQRLTRQAAEFAGIAGSGATDEDLIAQALKSSGGGTEDAILPQLPGDLRPIEGESGMSTFSGPICDLILAVFELDKKNNWLRRQAIVIILQQVLGGTIERKLRELVKSNTDEGHLVQLLATFRSELWPGGNLKPPSIPRRVDERARTRDEANRKLSALMPDLAANMIGRSNARRGARRIFAVLQNRRLNQHIVYTIIDEIVGALFPETEFGSGP